MLRIEKPRGVRAGRNEGSAPLDSTQLERKFLASAPLLSLLADWENEQRLVARRTPNSDYAEVLRTITDDLAKAIDKAARVDSWVSIQQLSELTTRPTSTLTRLCREQRQLVGAKKVCGSWMIHLPTFMAFLDNPSTEEEAA